MDERVSYLSLTTDHPPNVHQADTLELIMVRIIIKGGTHFLFYFQNILSLTVFVYRRYVGIF